MKLIKKIFIIVFTLLVILSALAYIDYFLVKTNNKVPKFSLKKDEKDFIVYSAPFYKVWYCKDSKAVILGGYDDPDAICSKSYEYVDGYYTNSSGIKIKKEDLELVTKNGIYTSEMVEAMKSDEEVEDAVYVADTYGRLVYKKKLDSKGNELIVNDDNYIVVFPEFVEVKDKYDWHYEEEYTDRVYCMEYRDGVEYFTRYNDGSCSKNYFKLKLDDKWCGKYKDSTLVYNEDSVKKLCEE